MKKLKWTVFCCLFHTSDEVERAGNINRRLTRSENGVGGCSKNQTDVVEFNSWVMVGNLPLLISTLPASTLRLQSTKRHIKED